MDIKTIERLQKLSAKAMENVPKNITLNSKGGFYADGHPVHPMTLLDGIEQTEATLREMDGIIQGISGRRQGKQRDLLGGKK